jgi:hypothetical protein
MVDRGCRRDFVHPLRRVMDRGSWHATCFAFRAALSPCGQVAFEEMRRGDMAMRFLLLMLAAFLGAVACQKDQAASNGAKDGVGLGASSKADVAKVNAAAAAADPAAPSAGAAEDEPVDDEAVSATDKSGVDDSNPSSNAEGTADSEGTDDAEEE